MNLYIDPSEIKSLQYIDNFFYDTLIIGFELNAEYIRIAERKLNGELGMFK